jgi:predicted nucleic acid-binding protein
VLLGEPAAAAIAEALGDYDQHFSSRLLRIELRRLALRHGALTQADQLLADVALLPLDPASLEAAETIEPQSVATLDAIHLVTAVRLAEAGIADVVMTYDAVLADGARAHGLAVVAP